MSGSVQPLRSRDALLLALAAFALYVATIGWGLPHATAPDRVKTVATDELLPLEALAEMRSTFVSPAPDRNLGYPWWHYFVLASAQAPYLGYLYVTGGLTTPTAEYPFGLSDPVRSLEVLTIIGRLVSVLMGAGVVVCVYAMAGTLWGRATGLVAGVLTVLCYPVVYYSRTGNLDVPALFWTALGYVVFARVLEHGLTRGRAALLGLFAALAMATKDQALVVFLPLGLALTLPVFQGRGGRYRFAPLLTGLGVSVAAYLVATGMLVDPHRHLEHVRRLLFAPEMLTTAVFYHPPHPATLGGVTAMIGDYGRAAAATLTLPVLAAAFTGALLALRDKPRALVLLVPAATLFLMMTLPTGIVVKRYLLSIVPVVDAFAALALVRLAAMAPWRRLALALGLLVTLGPRLLIALDLSWAQAHETRAAAGQWFREHATAGSRVEYFGPPTKLPPLAADVVTARVGGRTVWKGDFDAAPLLEHLARRGPEFVVVIPDWTSRPQMEHSGDCPEQVYEGLLDGRLGYDLVAHFETPSLLPRALRRPPLDNPSVAPPVRIFERRSGDAR